MAVLTVENLSFRYSLNDRPTLENISFSVEEGDFVVLCGATGSGKSTLLRMLKREMTPLGEQSGVIQIDSKPISSLPDRDAAVSVGFVLQRPEQQIVTDKVWHELAFGLENLGVDQSAIRRRTAEMASYFGIEEWFEKPTDSLSGGQKQLLNLAAVMAMQPRILLLDEPTAQLDPIAASDFLETVKKLNRETGLTVILIEHRLEEAIPKADKLLVLENGRVLHYDTPAQVCSQLRAHPTLCNSMPASVRLYASHPQGECPLDVREGRRWLQQQFSGTRSTVPLRLSNVDSLPEALRFSSVSFRYRKNDRDILSDLSFSLHSGEILCLLGGNGSGKSTTLKAASALISPYSGSIRVFGKLLKDYKNNSLYDHCLSMLPQDVQTVFLCSTVREELSRGGELPQDLPFDLAPLLDRHPYDLSGGEQQLVALTRVLQTCPRVLLLDEPTKGLDSYTRNKCITLLKTLRNKGTAILIVTHDVEFAADIADRCSLFFRGSIVSTDVPQEFFSGNSFYTTAISRMTRGLWEKAVTLADAQTMCDANGGAGK